VADKIFPRWVELADDREFIRVRSIGRFINDAMERWQASRFQGPTEDGLSRAEDDANFDYGFRNRATNPDNIASRLLDRRRKGVLQVYEAEGAGVLADDNVLRGSIRIDDFRRLLAEEWSMDLVVGGQAKATVGGVSQSEPETIASDPGPAPAGAASPQVSNAGRDARDPVADAAHLSAKLALVAGPAELVDAFGPILKRKWFENLSDRKWLQGARRFPGKSGRGGAPALFCPYAVMLGLMNSIKGKRMPQTQGWHRLRHNFPKVYETHEAEHPGQRRDD